MKPDQSVGQVIRHDGLAAVVRAAEKQGPDVTETIKQAIAQDRQREQQQGKSGQSAGWEL